MFLVFLLCLLPTFWTACSPPLHVQSRPQCIGPWNPYRPSTSHDSRQACLKFLTFNIRVAAGPGHLFTTVRKLPSSQAIMKKMAKAIGSVQPDVVALQEVRGSEQARFLAEALGMNHVYCPHGRPDLDWGLALLSRFEIGAVRSEVIHAGSDPRIGLVCSVKAPGRDILCLNLHYHLFGSYRNQAERTVALLQALEGPLVVMGDFNFSGAYGELAPIRERLADTFEVAARGTEEVRQRGTVLGWPRYRLDHVFLDPEHFRVEAVGLLPEGHRDTSDHIGYFACLTPL